MAKPITAKSIVEKKKRFEKNFSYRKKEVIKKIRTLEKCSNNRYYAWQYWDIEDELQDIDLAIQTVKRKLKQNQKAFEKTDSVLARSILLRKK